MKTAPKSMVSKAKRDMLSEKSIKIITIVITIIIHIFIIIRSACRPVYLDMRIVHTKDIPGVHHDDHHN